MEDPCFSLPDKLTYKIKCLGSDHTCVRVERNAEATSTWIATKFARTLKSNPRMTIEAIHDELIENRTKASRMQILTEGRGRLWRSLKGIMQRLTVSYDGMLQRL